MEKNIKRLLIAFGIVVLILVILLLLNFVYKRDEKYYKNISEVVISLFDSSDYSTSGINKSDIIKIDEYLSTLTHENELVNLNKFIDDNTDYNKNWNNSEGVIVENNVCYIYYGDIDFKLIEDVTVENSAVIYCDGYQIKIYEDSFMPEYSETLENPVHDYVYIGYNFTLDNYIGFYRSIYDGSEIGVFINLSDTEIDVIEVNGVNFNDYNIIK